MQSACESIRILVLQFLCPLLLQFMSSFTAISYCLLKSLYCRLVILISEITGQNLETPGGFPKRSEVCYSDKVCSLTEHQDQNPRLACITEDNSVITKCFNLSPLIGFCGRNELSDILEHLLC